MTTKFSLFLAFALMLGNVTLSQAKHNPFPFPAHRNGQTLVAKLKPRTRGLVSKPDNAKNFTWRDTIGGNWSNNNDGLGVLIHDNNEVFTYDANGNVTSDIITDTTGVNMTRNVYTYDAYNNQTSAGSQTWVSGAWVNNNQDVYSYDANGNLTLDIYQTWNSTTWENLNQTISAYDAKSNQTLNEYQIWNGTSWNNENQTLVTYDAQENATLYLDQVWQSGAWVTQDGEKDIYTYDANNHATSDISQMYDLGSWVNSTKSVYTVDATGAWLTYTVQEWIGATWANAINIYNITWKDFSSETPLGYTLQGFSTGSWKDSLKLSSTYDSYGGSVMINQLMTNGSWVNSERITEEYDAHDNFTTFIVEEWLGSSWQIFEQYNFIYTYSLSDDITREIFQLWNDDMGNLVNWTRTDFSNFQYFAPSGVENVNAAKLISVYPNPTSEQLNISLDKADFNVASISIFNFLGQNVMGLNGVNTSSSNISLPVNELPSGIYFVRLTGTDQSSVTKKFVKE